jgi:hypothetical protein
VRFHYVPAKFQKEKNFAATNVATARRQANATALIQIAVVIKNTEEPSVMSFEVRPIAWPSPVLWWIAMTTMLHILSLLHSVLQMYAAYCSVLHRFFPVHLLQNTGAYTKGPSEAKWIVGR